MSSGRLLSSMILSAVLIVLVSVLIVQHEEDSKVQYKASSSTDSPLICSSSRLLQLHAHRKCHLSCAFDG